ncbi:hypothetical protein Tco_0979512 [Tanacetum coccineum]
MKNKITTSRKWQKWFENQSSFNWSAKSPTEQTPPSVSKSSSNDRTHSKTLVTSQKWVAKMSIPPSEFVSCDAEISLRNSWEQSASEMITLKQSLDMEIMFKEISQYALYITLKVLDTIFSRSDNFVMENLK